MLKKSPPSKSFTKKFNTIVNDIIINIGISLPGDIEKLKEAKTLRGLWDTGATNCVITKKTAEKLGLKPIGIAPVYHAGGKTFENEYFVNIYLPNNVYFPNSRITECRDTTGRFDFIIGMNIISRGDFAITNCNGRTTVSFRWPSLKEIDFVDEFYKKEGKRIGRNDPCPCGSGKKYKYCHGKIQ